MKRTNSKKTDRNVFPDLIQTKREFDPIAFECRTDRCPIDDWDVAYPKFYANGKWWWATHATESVGVVRLSPQVLLCFPSLMCFLFVPSLCSALSLCLCVYPAGCGYLVLPPTNPPDHLLLINSSILQPTAIFKPRLIPSLSTRSFSLLLVQMLWSSSSLLFPHVRLQDPNCVYLCSRFTTPVFHSYLPRPAPSLFPCPVSSSITQPFTCLFRSDVLLCQYQLPHSNKKLWC